MKISTLYSSVWTSGKIIPQLAKLDPHLIENLKIVDFFRARRLTLKISVCFRMVRRSVG